MKVLQARNQKALVEVDDFLPSLLVPRILLAVEASSGDSHTGVDES